MFEIAFGIVAVPFVIWAICAIFGIVLLALTFPAIAFFWLRQRLNGPLVRQNLEGWRKFRNR